MPQASDIATIHASVVQGIVGEIDRAGADGCVLLERAGMQASLLDLRPSTPVAEEPVWGLLALAGQLIGPEFGRRAGRVGLDTLGSLGAKVGQGLTVHQALRTLVVGAKAVSSETHMWLSEDTEHVWIVRDPDSLGSQPGADQAELYLVSVLESLVQRAAGASWGSPHLRLRHDTARAFPGDRRVDTRQAVTGIAIPRAHVHLPLHQVTAPEERHESPGVALLRSMMEKAISAGTSLSLEDASDVVGWSRATLKRRLQEEGLSFRQLTAQTRFAICLPLLRDEHLNVLEIGERVGYRHAAHFTRAFRSWTGTSPTAYRRLRIDTPARL